MTEDEIKKMPAGIDLDFLVAENVMGWKWIDTPIASRLLVPPEYNQPDLWRPEWRHEGYPLPPSYSLSISDAWEVIERLNELGYGMELYRSGYEGSEWEISLGGLVSLFAKDFPLVICRAALLSILDMKHRE